MGILAAAILVFLKQEHYAGFGAAVACLQYHKCLLILINQMGMQLYPSRPRLI